MTRERRSGLDLILVPRAETVLSRQGRIEGGLDVPLSPRGASVTRKLLNEDLKEIGKVEAVYAAGNQGARETAEILAAADSQRIRILPELGGISCGLWEGQLAAEIRERHARVYGRWQADPFSVTPPGGEEMGAAFERARSAARTILKRHRGGRVVVVASRTVLGLLYCHLTGSPVRGVFDVARGFGRFEILRALPGSRT